MTTNTLNPELERRVAELEIEANQGASFTTFDWLCLFALGIVGPAILLVWGWQP